MSRKKRSLQPEFLLHLNGDPLESITSFKYLGVYISSDLSWSEQQTSVCEAQKNDCSIVSELLSPHSRPQVLQLYKSLVRPHLDYAAVMWSPHLQSDKLLLEGVQKFALHMVTRGWHLSYPDLLYETGVMSLQSHREVARLCHLYKILNSLCYSDLCVFSVYTGRSYHSHPLSIKPLFCRTNSFSHSFVPFTIHLWNCLDSSLHSVKSGSAPVGNCLAHSHTQVVRQPTHPACADQEMPWNWTIVPKRLQRLGNPASTSTYTSCAL